MASGSEDRTFESGGESRRYLLEVPEGTRGLVPLVVDLHGTFADAPTQLALSNLDDAAREDGFVAVWPESRSPGGLDAWVLSCDSADLTFIDELLDTLEAELCIDPSRIWLTGVSNGGYFAEIVAARLEGRIAGIAPVAAGLGLMPALCPPAEPLPVQVVHGTDDAVVPFTEGETTRDFWTGHDACPPAVSDGDCELSGPCADGTEVRWCPAEGVGHLAIYAQYPTTDRIREFFGTR